MSLQFVEERSALLFQHFNGLHKDRLWGQRTHGLDGEEEVILDTGRSNRIHQLRIPEHISTTTVVPGICNVGTATLIDLNDAGGEALLQELRVTSCHRTIQLNLGQESVMRCGHGRELGVILSHSLHCNQF